jgi:hypothetical protein
MADCSFGMADSIDSTWMTWMNDEPKKTNDDISQIHSRIHFQTRIDMKDRPTSVTPGLREGNASDPGIRLVPSFHPPVPNIKACSNMVKSKSIVLLSLAIACASAEAFTPQQVVKCAAAKLNGIARLPATV